MNSRILAVAWRAAKKNSLSYTPSIAKAHTVFARSCALKVPNRRCATLAKASKRSYSERAAVAKAGTPRHFTPSEMPVKAVNPDCSSPAVFVVQGALERRLKEQLAWVLAAPYCSKLSFEQDTSQSSEGCPSSR